MFLVLEVQSPYPLLVISSCCSGHNEGAAVVSFAEQLFVCNLLLFVFLWFCKNIFQI